MIAYNDLPKWETVAQDTYRLRIPSGFLYRYQTQHTHFQTTPAIVFVPWTEEEEAGEIT